MERAGFQPPAERPLNICLHADLRTSWLKATVCICHHYRCSDLKSGFNFTRKTKKEKEGKKITTVLSMHPEIVSRLYRTSELTVPLSHCGITAVHCHSAWSIVSSQLIVIFHGISLLTKMLSLHKARLSSPLVNHFWLKSTVCVGLLTRTTSPWCKASHKAAAPSTSLLLTKCISHTGIN